MLTTLAPRAGAQRVEVASMSDSEPSLLSKLGITTGSDTGSHGREPGQTDLGPHPATQFVGLIQNHDNPQRLTIHERGVGRPELGTHWIQVDIEDTVSLEAQR